MSYQALITNQQCSKYFSYIVVVSFIGGSATLLPFVDVDMNFSGAKKFILSEIVGRGQY
jgi:hypothetical protein